MATKLEILRAKAESIYAAIEEEGYEPTAAETELLAKVWELENSGGPTSYYLDDYVY